MRILLIQLRQLGDIILTTPCIREIRRERPDAHITFLCHKMGKLIVEDNPYLDEIIYYDEGASFVDSVKFLASIRSGSYDLVIDFMNNPRSALQTLVSGAEQRVSFQTKRSFSKMQSPARTSKRQDAIAVSPEAP